MKSRAELITCMLTIGILALLLCSAAKPQRSHQAICANHLRQLRLDAAQYEEDNCGSFPPVNACGKTRQVYWPDFLRPYVRDVRNFACPADTLGGAEQLQSEDDLLPSPYHLRYVSFGMNYWLGPNVTHNPKHRYPYNVRRVKNPNYVIYLGDSSTLELRPTSCWSQDYAPVHDGTANFLFVDGHVEPMNRNNLGLYSQAKDGWKIDQKRWSDWTER